MNTTDLPDSPEATVLRNAYYEACLTVAQAFTNLSAATTMVLYAPSTERIAVLHKHRRLTILALDAWCEAITARRGGKYLVIVEQGKIHATQVEVGVFGVHDLLALAETYRRKADNCNPVITANVDEKAKS